MPNAIFIDTSNLNTLFKVNDRFALGANYSSSLERIAIDAQALGASFDVYLSMWPRPQGEGDDIINSLSIGGVPFVVLRDEVAAVLSLMERVPGVGTIYLCNALQNFMSQARVSNFKSVINYGDRIALVSVQDKLIEDLTVYDGPTELQEEMGDNFTCYGDLDLIDVDAIKAQYSEFTGVNKAVLVPLSHLITSYRSQFNVEAEEVKRELGLGEYERRREETPPPEPPKPKRRTSPPPPPPVEHNEPDDWMPKKAKPKISLVNVLLVLIILVSSAVCGLGYSFDKKLPEIGQLQNEAGPFSTEASKYADLANIYTGSFGLAGKASELLTYVQTNTASFSVAGLEVRAGSAVIRCNTVSVDNLEPFKAYLESGGFVVGETNQLENTVGVDNTTIYNYNIVVVLS